MASHPSEPQHSLIQQVNHCLQTRAITQAQYQALSALILADGQVDEAERQQLNSLFEAIQRGEVAVVD
ncbi:MAG TPA: hypothetical protein IGR64_01485 [Leptolyngbyaceae cyanobacterium M65_K2018_010]|nr:hypothetical protein [Leptolyngbyaceae cyanobacterium M65_K2018_010]